MATEKNTGKSRPRGMGRTAAKAKAQAPKKKANRIPAGERPKQLSGLAKTVKSAARGGVGVAGPSYKGENITAGEAAIRASRIRKREAKAAAMAKSGKASTSYSPNEMSKRAQSAMGERAMEKQLSKYGMSKTEYGYKLNVGKKKNIVEKIADNLKKKKR
jgi:hypothetical protein